MPGWTQKKKKKQSKKAWTKQTQNSRSIHKVPWSCQWACFGFTVADHARHNQVWRIECGAKCVRESVAELTTFVNRAGRLGRNMRRNAIWDQSHFDVEYWIFNENDKKINFCYFLLKKKINCNCFFTLQEMRIVWRDVASQSRFAQCQDKSRCKCPRGTYFFFFFFEKKNQ